MLPKNDVTHLKYFYIYTSVADFVLSVPFFMVSDIIYLAAFPPPMCHFVSVFLQPLPEKSVSLNGRLSANINNGSLKTESF